ncbi:MAG: nitrous oxide reductase accessory protein NosL [Alphaproteobacteria bacterium]|nr:nitrous oxide reductase accessory protein NosL [Alphaproteobacteria bacterium]
MTQAAIGHYCGMALLDHPGPKGQIHVAGRPAPYWFSSVRDTKAFTLLPEEPKTIAAIYVTDTGQDGSSWIEAGRAVYVIGSDQMGGMGAPEAVPFGDRAAADLFAKEHGGRVVAWNAIPADYVLGGAEASHDAH